MPAPHFSTWDKLAWGLDPAAIGADNLAAHNARHALPRYKRWKHYRWFSHAMWIPYLALTAWTMSTETDRHMLMDIAFSLGLGIVLVGSFTLGLLDRSHPLLRRRRREALIHPHRRALATAHTEPPTHDPLLLAELIGCRRDYWSRRLGGYRFWDWIIFACVSFWWVVFTPMVLVVPQLLSAIGVDYILETYLFWPVMLSPFIVMALLGRRRLRRLSLSLVHRICPDCGYSLEDAPDAALPHTGQVLGLGPRRCIECGVPWPLLPPPKAI